MADIVALRRADRKATGHASTGGAIGRATAGRDTGKRATTGPATVSRPDRDRLATVTELVQAAGLAGVVRPASVPLDTGPAGVDRMLPVLPELRRLLPGGGLRRGATVAVDTGPPAFRLAGTIGAGSLLLALVAAASAGGCWCAVVGVPAFGAAAAAEFGVDLGRLVLVPEPGPDWPSVVAALLDGVGVVVAAPPGPVAAPVCARLAARARQRGNVLVPYGPWQGADVVLEAVRVEWQGLGTGRGRLRRAELTVTARGRGSAALPREARMWLPPSNTPEPVEPTGRPVTEVARSNVALSEAALSEVALSRAVAS